jgi:hypothetical protein
MSGYIGTQPLPQATQTRDSFTATSGQTSFATGGYTPNFLDVYLNGVKLASADYTASNGSDVVLASGAATGDILEVVAFTTFTPADLPAGTPSIDDNGNATAITIDSNENVMLGTTTSTLYNVSSGTGFSYRNGVALDIARQNTSSAEPLLNLNLTGVDGSHILFYKDGTTVGSIGVSGGDNLHIASDDTNDVGIKFNGDGNRITPCNALGADRGSAIDLGEGGNAPFKDLYLSGGVYLGGTGSANKLDDYEEGTWTPSYSSGYSVSSYTNQNGFYTKIGNVVRASFRLNMSSSSTTAAGVQITGLPFTHTDTLYITGTNYINAAVANGDAVKILVNPNSNTINLYYQGTTGVTGLVGTNLGTQLDILGQVIYEV